MNGTEKQIEYAKSLIAKTIKKAQESLEFKSVDQANRSIEKNIRKFGNGEISQDELNEELEIANSIISDVNMIENIIAKLISFDGSAHDAIEALGTIDPVRYWQNYEMNAKTNGGKTFWAFINN